jgi:hypothetical protein
MFKKFNMVRTGLLFVVLTAGINVCFGQMYWTNSFAGETYPQATQPTKDGNYIIAGNTMRSGPFVGWSAKIDPKGDTLWTKTFGEPANIQFFAMESIDGEFFLLIGDCRVDGVDPKIGVVVKINTKGDVIWTRTYEKLDKCISFRAIQKCSDGNFLIAGLRADYFSSLLVNITPDGDTLWTRSSGGFLESIQASSDGNYLVAGSSQTQALLLKINNSGKILWTRNYSNSINWGPKKIYPAGDRNYLLLGQLNGDALLLKITPEGDTIWTRTYPTPGSEDYFLDIISSMDGGFLILAEKLAINGSIINQSCLKINKMGDTLWTITTYGYGYATYSKILPAGKGTFLVLGSTSTNWTISCMVDDQYANKGSLFKFKIPTRGLDSLNYGYQPLKVPTGIEVSAGGTVSWTPQTDSSYLENAKFVVVDDQGRKDTLSLNIFVNMKNQSDQTRTIHRISQDKVPDVITISSYPQRGKVQLSFPTSAVFLSIYDMSGRLIDRISPVSSKGRQTIIWPVSGTGFHSGHYIARAVVGKQTQAKVFMLTR